MIDGPCRRAVKSAARALFAADLRLHRALRRLGARPRHDLAGACRSCGQCCDWPSIQVGRLFWHLPTWRRVFLWWQQRVNGFDFVRADPASRVYVFRCGHLDPATRACDSYGSRPGICRDYPRALLAQPWPEFFEGCGYRPIATDGAGLRSALAAVDLTEEKRAELGRKLHLG